MIRLHITTEGQTEEKFVNLCLKDHLAAFQVFCDARCVLTSKDTRLHRSYRGGFCRTQAYQTVKKDIINWLIEDKSTQCRFSTMFDFYGLPKDFPGYAESLSITDVYQKISYLEKSFYDDIGDSRFIPYIQLHEFETLIFANPQELDWEYLEHDDAIERLKRVAEAYGNPELINDGFETSPSKRIIDAIPEHTHNKTSGALIVQKIGIPLLKRNCQHFCSWLQCLGSLNE